MTPGLGADLLAHGVGGRTDLPLATPLAVTGALWAVAASFVAVSVMWPPARSATGSSGRPVPEGLQRIVDNRLLRDVLRLVVLAAAVLVGVVALGGPSSTALNLAPYALYVTFWVGLVLVSLLLGPVWRVVNPLRFIHRGLSRLLRRSPESGVFPLPPALGWWPAATWLALFIWLELVPEFRSEPVVVGSFLGGYAVVNLVAALAYGSGWFDRGDGFEAYSTLIGVLSPVRRRSDGRLVVGHPLDGAAAIRDEPGLLALLLVLIGGTAFDGLTRTRIWVERIPSDSIIAGTLGLAGVILLVAALYRQAMKVVWRNSRADATAMTAGSVSTGTSPAKASAGFAATAIEATGSTGTALPGWFAPSLVPIAVGYAIAHYFSLFLFEGQQTWILASDPFRTGADYLGTRDVQVNYTALSTSLIGYIQIGAIVAGHIVGVLIAHDRAVRIFGEMEARRSQYPLMGVMLLFTGVAVALLVST